MTVERGDEQEVDRTVLAVIGDVLGISADRLARFDETAPLFGSIPELDSMAVAGLLTELEDRLGIVIDDEDVDGDLLATLGSLTAYARAKALR